MENLLEPQIVSMKKDPLELKNVYHDPSYRDKVEELEEKLYML